MPSHEIGQHSSRGAGRFRRTYWPDIGRITPGSLQSLPGDMLRLHWAKVQANVSKALSSDKKLFSLVSKSKAAEALAERGRSHIDVEETGKVSQEAAGVMGVFTPSLTPARVAAVPDGSGRHGAGFEDQIPRITRMQSSTFSMASGETIPRRRVIRSSEIDRKASLMAKLRVFNPASPASIATRDRIPLSLDVIGATITRPLGPWLNWSAETTKAGRFPPCSCPSAGSRLTSHTSPRTGLSVTIGC